MSSTKGKSLTETITNKTPKQIQQEIKNFNLQEKIVSSKKGKTRGLDLKFNYVHDKSPKVVLEKMKKGKWSPITLRLPKRSQWESPDKSALEDLSDAEEQFDELANKEFGKIIGEKYPKSARRWQPKNPQECPLGTYFRQANIAEGYLGEQVRGSTCAVLPIGNDWVEALSVLSNELRNSKQFPPIPANVLAKFAKASWEGTVNLSNKPQERIQEVVKAAYKSIQNAQNKGTLKDDILNHWVVSLKRLEEKLKAAGFPSNITLLAEILSRYWKQPPKTEEEINEAINNAYDDAIAQIKNLRERGYEYEPTERPSYTERTDEQKKEMLRSERQRHKAAMRYIAERNGF